MIGTHDSYTFLPARKKIFELFSFLWRTQVKNITQQKEIGVTYFDVRVRRDGHVWRVRHGLVDFNKTFKSIEEIISKFNPYRIRILLEKGNYNDEVSFIKELDKCLGCPNLSFAGIKRGWRVIINRDPNMIDYTYTPWISGLSFWENIKRFNFFSTIKKQAKKHNPIINNDIKKDNTIYFMDYV